jgi:DNA-binding IscR family transcriptional regulator
MGVVAERFRRAAATTAPDISEATGVAEVTVTTMLDRLVAAGLLHRLEGDGGGVTLARPPDRIAASELMEVGFALVDQSASGSRPALLERLRAAQQTLAAQSTLAQLLPPQAVGNGADQVRAV